MVEVAEVEATVEAVALAEAEAVEDMVEVQDLEEMAIDETETGLIIGAEADLAERNAEILALEEILKVNARPELKPDPVVKDSMPQKGLLIDAAGNLF